MNRLPYPKGLVEKNNVGVGNNAINPLEFGVAYLYLKKPLGFLMFSGGIDKQHRAVMG